MPLVNAYGIFYRGKILGREVKIIPLHHPGFLVMNPIPLRATSEILSTVRGWINGQ